MAPKITISNHRQKQEENAVSDEFKIKQLEGGIERATQNVALFTQKAQEQMVLKVQLEAELSQLKADQDKN